MLSTNYWGHKLPLPHEIPSMEGMRVLLTSLLRSVGSLLGASETGCGVIVDTAFSAGARVSLSQYEGALKGLFRHHADRGKIEIAIEDRSRIVSREIEPFLIGTSLLDVGCGNGLIAMASAHKFEKALLLDVLKYLKPAVTLPFCAYSDGDRLPVADRFDTVLLLTVLHHSNEPLSLLREAWRATAKRLIIIESVFGATDVEATHKYELAGRSLEDQLSYAVYVDWLYNRVLENDIPVPYNFTTPDHWLEVFQKEKMTVMTSLDLGQDIPVAPELHYLFVLERP